MLRRLFVEHVVDFKGRCDQVDRAALLPKPAHSIPIWLGGSGEKAFDRAARLADGFIFFGAGGIHGAVASWKSMLERLTTLDPSVDDFGAENVALSQSVRTL